MTEETQTPDETPEPAAAEAKKKNSVSPKAEPETVPTVFSVVGNDPQDTVILRAIVYKNIFAQKSLSVHHLQRRLNEWGYAEAYADKDGWYGDLTEAGVLRFQQENGLEASGRADIETLSLLFKDDTNVTLDFG